MGVNTVIEDLHLISIHVSEWHTEEYHFDTASEPLKPFVGCTQKKNAPLLMTEHGTRLIVFEGP